MIPVAKFIKFFCKDFINRFSTEIIFALYRSKISDLVEYPVSGVGLNGNPITMSYSEGFSQIADRPDIYDNFIQIKSENWK